MPTDAGRAPEANDYYVTIDPIALDDTASALLRARMYEIFDSLAPYSRGAAYEIRAGFGSPEFAPADHAADHAAERDVSTDRDVPEFTPVTPSYRFEQLVLPERVLARLLDAVALVEVAPLVFDRWNLRSIEPNPSVALSFRGPPGTGKTLAAHAIAHRLGRPIMLARLSDLESKYHGDGPKNLVGLFSSAQRSGAVLFIDEAESLLSRRFAQPQQAAESAINSMRTELLMAVDAFDGLVIFASNLPHSYDVALESRIVPVDFELPDLAARRLIWRSHCPPQLPLADDVDLDALAALDGLSGRDIKMAVIAAAVRAARTHVPAVTHDMLREAAVDRQRELRPATEPDGDEPLPRDALELIEARLRSEVSADAAGG